jgi:glycerol-3-phosphate dehydrogenase
VNSFSANNRSSILVDLCQTSYDVLVIGGGITGAGIALDATSRGMRTGIIEMQDFASGTSGRSTKLIHGGLRYLKQLEFRLVSEIGKEREIVHQIAPHLTKPEHMLLPLYKGGSLGKISGKIGMGIYEWLAGVKKEEWHKILSVEETLRHEPLLPKKDLLGGILFYEYRTDDARLTLDVMKEAVSRGAKALNYLKMTSFLYDNNKVSGIRVKDQLSGETGEINATYIVNATGPWVDLLSQVDNAETPHKLHITKGIHLVIDQKKLPVNQSLYFDTFDQRMIFVIPREGKTYIGTTDTFYSGDITHPLVENTDAAYLIKCLNVFFPSLHLLETDIESAWAGLRPLIMKPGKGPSEISRKDEIFESTSGLITIAGGKLTGYRKMAQRVVDKISSSMQTANGNYFPVCSTENISLSGGKFRDLNNYKEYASLLTANFSQSGLTREDMEALVDRYGSNTPYVLERLEVLKQKEKHELPLLLRAQLHYSVEEELCCSLSDFLIRRTSYAYFHTDELSKWKIALLNYMSELLSWDENIKTQNLHNLESSLKELKIQILS